MFALQPADTLGAIALQSAAATPELAPPLVFWVVLCVFALVVGAVGSAVARRLSNPVGKYRLLYVGVVLPLGVVAYGLLAVLDLGAAVRAALVGPSADPGVVGAYLAEFLTLSAAGGVALVAYAPTIRGVRAVRDIDLGTGRAVALLARWLVGASAVLALVLAPLRVGAVGSTSTVVLAAVLVAAVVGLLAGSPWVIGALRSTSRPTGDGAGRLDGLRERAGLGAGAVRDVRLLDTDDEGTANAFVRGIGPTRRLFVTTTFLDAFDDDTATALLAVQAGRLRSRALARRFVAVLAPALALLAAFAGDGGPDGAFVAVALVALVVGLWYARRGILAGDDRAAERVGADAVADAFEGYAAFHALEPSRRRVPNPFSATVPLGDRIDRLRERGDGDGSGGDDPGGDGTDRAASGS